MLAGPAGTDVPEEPVLRPTYLLALSFVLSMFASPGRAANPEVSIGTAVGDIVIELCQEVSTLCTHAAPNTVANFLAYLDDDAYLDSFIHRSVTNFVIQGGTFIGNHVNFPATQVVLQDPVLSEFTGFPNARGTVSVPLSSDPPGSSNPCDTAENSGTSGWFINIGNNVGLDCGLFTVFGVVTTEAGMTVATTINQLFRLGLQFGTAPMLTSYVCAPNPSGGCTGNPIPHLVYTDISRVPEPGAALGSAIAFASLAALKRRCA